MTSYHADEDRAFWRRASFLGARGQAVPCNLRGWISEVEDVVDFKVAGTSLDDPHELDHRGEDGVEDEASWGVRDLGV